MTDTKRPDWLLPPVETLTEFPAVHVAYQLSRLCRYAGATPYFYSVARHSILVASLVADDPKLRLLALVHDVHECWIGDVLRPAKLRLGRALDDLAREYDEKLWALLGLDASPADRYLVEMADTEACRLEMEYLGMSYADITEQRRCGRNENWLLSARQSVAADSQDWLREVSEERAAVN